MHPTNKLNDPELCLVQRATIAHQKNSERFGSQISRTWNILKYYRKSQIARRVMSVISNKAGLTGGSVTTAITSTPPVRAQNEFDTLRSIRSTTCYRDANQIGQSLTQGEIRLLNSTHALRWRIDDERTLLWQFQLHYHEFLLPLAASQLPSGESNPVDLELIENTIASWIDENPISNRACHLDAWHPYCISRRLPVWFCLLTIPTLDDSLRERMLRSAHDQADYLSHNLEWGLRGNHLLENIRALALAGFFFNTDASSGWLATVRKLLPQQIKEQVLEYGEHFERCPMYHCQILGNFLEILIVSRNVDPQMDPMIRTTAEKMFGFLVEIVHPDGEIPLLGDSCFGEAPNVNCLEQLATAAKIECPPDSMDDKAASPTGPYWVFRDQNDFLIFDRGPAGADSLPAHSHCDLLTLEASLDGVRWIVDSGLNNYEDDPMRWYCRSSLAHNIVCVENQNQFDIWSKFRMGQRGWPTQMANGREGDCCWATASHNAYRRFGLRRISRLIGIEKKRYWYCLDRAETNNTRSLTGFVHLGCDVGVSQLAEDRFLLNIGKTVGELSFVGASEVKLVEGRYCPEFGLQTKNVVIEYAFASNNTPVAGWMLWLDDTMPSRAQPLAKLDVHQSSEMDSVTISASERTVHQFNWKFAK